MNIRHAAVAASAICALTTAGCGTNSGTSHSTDPGVPAVVVGLPHTLVGSDYNSVTLVETQTQNGSVTGTFDTTEVDYNSPQHQRATVSGTIKGGQVSLTVSFPLGSTVFTGTLDGSTLTLQVPQKNGQIEGYVLKPGTVDDYNEHVNQLESGGGSSPSPSPTARPSKFY